MVVDKVDKTAGMMDAAGPQGQQDQGTWGTREIAAPEGPVGEDGGSGDNADRRGHVTLKLKAAAPAAHRSNSLRHSSMLY